MGSSIKTSIKFLLSHAFLSSLCIHTLSLSLPVSLILSLFSLIFFPSFFLSATLHGCVKVSIGSTFFFFLKVGSGKNMVSDFRVRIRQFSHLGHSVHTVRYAMFVRLTAVPVMRRRTAPTPATPQSTASMR